MSKKDKKVVITGRKMLLIIGIFTIGLLAVLAIYEILINGTPILYAFAEYGVFSIGAFLPLIMYFLLGLSDTKKKDKESESKKDKKDNE